MYVGEVYELKRNIMIRREMRDKYVTEKGLSEFNINWVSGYTIWLEFQLQELSKLHQPAVISSVCGCCDGSGKNMNSTCGICNGSGKKPQTDL